MRPVNLVLIGLALGGFIGPAHIAWAQAAAPSGTVITIAGNGVSGFSGDGGPAVSASNSGPYGSAIGPDGTLYFADNNNFRIRAVNPVTGIITTVAGIGPPPGFLEDGPNGDGGPATSAQIGDVLSIAIDRQRNTLYLPSVSLSRVRQIDLSTGIIENYAGIGMFDNELGFQDGDGGPATSAYILFSLGVAVGPDSDVFITDYYRLRRVDDATGIIDSVAGIEDAIGLPVNMFGGDGGPASAASFNFPYTLTVDSAGDVYVIDLGVSEVSSARVRRIDSATGIIDTIAGGGTMTPGSGLATDMNLDGATDVAVDDAAGLLYVAVWNQVFQMDLATGQLSLFAGLGTAGFSGDGGPALAAEFNNIYGLEVVPGGGLLVSDTFNARIRYIAPNSIHLSGDSGQTDFYLPWVSALSGDITITNNPNLSVIGMGSLISAGGDIQITDNSSATAIDMGSLGTVGGDIEINNNTAAAVIGMGSLISAGGDIQITDNSSATAIDMGSLGTVGGDIEINNNTAAAVIGMGSLISISGDATIETTGSGTFDVDGADVEGNTSLTTDGYTEVDAATAAGETAVTMLNSEATMEVTLPDGAFSSANPVTFSVERLPGGGVETVGGEMITHLETYAFDFAIPTLNSAAELNFEINLVALDEPDRLALVDLLHQSAELTIGVRGDAPGAELQLFDVCSGTGATVDGCVVVEWLDETRMLLDPLGNIDPSILRFEALVGHFSTYSVVAVGLAGDYNHNGVVDAADYVVWRDTLGQTGTGLAADGNNSGTIDASDYTVWKTHFGQTAGSGSSVRANAAVPEPATLVQLILTAVGLCLWWRSSVSRVS